MVGMFAQKPMKMSLDMGWKQKIEIENIEMRNAKKKKKIAKQKKIWFLLHVFHTTNCLLARSNEWITN